MMNISGAGIGGGSYTPQREKVTFEASAPTESQLKKNLWSDSPDSDIEKDLNHCIDGLSKPGVTASMQAFFKPSEAPALLKHVTNKVRLKANDISEKGGKPRKLLQNMARLLLNDVSTKQGGGIDANSLVDIEEYLIEYIGNPEKFNAIFPKNDDEFYGRTIAGLSITPAAIALEKINEQDLAATTKPLTGDDKSKYSGRAAAGGAPTFGSGGGEIPTVEELTEMLSNKLISVEDKLEKCMEALSNSNRSDSLSTLFQPSTSKTYSDAFSKNVRIIESRREAPGKLLRDLARLRLNDVHTGPRSDDHERKLDEIVTYLTNNIGNPTKFEAIFPKDDSEFYDKPMGDITIIPIDIAIAKIEGPPRKASPVSVLYGAVSAGGDGTSGKAAFTLRQPAAEMAAATTSAPITVNTLPTTVAELRARPEGIETLLSTLKIALTITHSNAGSEKPGFVDHEIALFQEALAVKPKTDFDDSLNIILFTSKKLMESGLKLNPVANDGKCLFSALAESSGLSEFDVKDALVDYMLDVTNKDELDGYLNFGGASMTRDGVRNCILNDVWNSAEGDVIAVLAAKVVANRTGREVMIIFCESKTNEKLQPKSGVITGERLAIVNTGSHFEGTSKVDSSGGGLATAAAEMAATTTSAPGGHFVSTENDDSRGDSEDAIGRFAGTWDLGTPDEERGATAAAEMEAATTSAPISVKTVPTTVAELKASPENKETLLKTVKEALIKTRRESVDKKINLLREVLDGNDDLEAKANSLLFTSNELMKMGLSLNRGPKDGKDLYSALSISSGIPASQIKEKIEAVVDTESNKFGLRELIGKEMASLTGRDVIIIYSEEDRVSVCTPKQGVGTGESIVIVVANTVVEDVYGTIKQPRRKIDL